MNKYDEYSVIPQLVDRLREEAEIESWRREVLYQMFCHGEVPAIEYLEKSECLEKAINDLMNLALTTDFDYIFNSD